MFIIFFRYLVLCHCTGEYVLTRSWTPLPRIILGANFLVYQIYSVFIHDIRQGRIQEKVQLQIFTSGDYIQMLQMFHEVCCKKGRDKENISKIRNPPPQLNAEYAS